MDTKPLISKWLAVGIILLFLGTSVIPAMGQNTEETASVSRGGWLYVGGTGPGNYTRIQDAINASFDGDVVFVFNDSSPYYENIIIEKSITLMGEDKYSTFIERNSSVSPPYLSINVSDVTVCNFTFPHGGIYVWSGGPVISNILIADNIFHNGGIGAYDSSVIVKRNILENSYYNPGSTGISINSDPSDPKPLLLQVEDNSIRNHTWGIRVLARKITTAIITHNTITKCGTGIYFDYGRRLILINNHFQDNMYGIEFPMCKHIFSKGNNFINNLYHVAIYNSFLTFWNENYWDDWKGSGPYAIKGYLYFDLLTLRLPWYFFDRHPAQEPYDIPRVIEWK